MNFIKSLLHITLLFNRPIFVSSYTTNKYLYIFDDNIQLNQNDIINIIKNQNITYVKVNKEYNCYYKFRNQNPNIYKITIIQINNELSYSLSNNTNISNIISKDCINNIDYENNFALFILIVLVILFCSNCYSNSR